MGEGRIRVFCKHHIISKQSSKQAGKRPLILVFPYNCSILFCFLRCLCLVLIIADCYHPDTQIRQSVRGTVIMALSYCSGIVLLLTAWIVHAWVKNELSWVRSRRFGRKYGCEEPKAVKNTLPGGIERYLGLLMFKKGMCFMGLDVVLRVQVM